MKTMKCSELGGACDLEFKADTFEEIAELSKKHGTEMFHAGDKSHLAAMNKMRDIMSKPNGMQEWLASKKAAFDALPHE